jgi:hypothetical protein
MKEKRKTKSHSKKQNVPLPVVDSCEQFSRYVDQIQGAYLDATMAMGGMASWYMQMDRARWPELEKKKGAVSWEEFNPEIIYGGSVKGKKAELHRTRLQDLINRNSPGGSNWVFLALMCVVGVYQIWEEHSRGEIASALGVKKNEVTGEVFGEVRHLRGAVIHNRGYATREVARAKITPAFAEGTPIILDPQDLHEVFDSLKVAVRGFIPRRRRSRGR